MTMTLTAVQELDDRPRVRLSVSTTLGGSAWVSLWRTHEDGSRFRVLVDRNARLTGGAWVGYDYHAPLAGHDVTYEAVTASESATAEVFLDGVVPWLVHATNPDLSMPIEYVPEDGFGAAGIPQMRAIPGMDVQVGKAFADRADL